MSDFYPYFQRSFLCRLTYANLLTQDTVHTHIFYTRMPSFTRPKGPAVTHSFFSP